MAPTLRPATMADFETILELRTQYRGYVERHYGGWDASRARQHLMDHWKRRTLWIIRSGGTEVGYLDLADEDDHLLIGNIIIHPSHQRRGLGTAVLLELLDKLDNKPARLQVFRDNPARSLYERLGFRVIATTAHHHRMERSADHVPGDRHT